MGVCPAWSVFAAGSGDMTASVGGGERGDSANSDGGSEMRATSDGRFLRRRRRVGETLALTFIFEEGVASVGSSSSLLGISSGGVFTSV